MHLRHTLSALCLGALAACGGSATDADPLKLLQENKLDEAVRAAEIQLAGVEKGSQDERDLMLIYVEVLSHRDGDKAADAFISFAKANEQQVTPRDFKAAVSFLRSQQEYLAAAKALSAAEERWPENSELESLSADLKAELEASKHPDAAKALKGMPYGG